MTPDDVARVTLASALEIDQVVRAGVATSNGAGRELSFVASDDDAVSAVAVRWCRIEGLADVPLAEAVRTGNPIFLDSLNHLARRYPHLLERQRLLGTRAMAALPMTVANEAIGGLLLSFGTDRHFDHNEQAFLAALAAQVTQAMKRALKFQVQQTTSELLQRSLMPESIPELTDLAMGAYYEPGGSGVDVGGDWYDVMPLADERVVVALGDVMGKGVPAAIVMGQVRCGDAGLRPDRPGAVGDAGSSRHAGQLPRRAGADRHPHLRPHRRRPPVHPDGGGWPSAAPPRTTG